jgi:hypothetical protein
VCSGEWVQYHEVVDDPAVPGGGDGHAGGAQLGGVRLALVAQHVGFAVDDRHYTWFVPWRWQGVAGAGRMSA